MHPPSIIERSAWAAGSLLPATLLLSFYSPPLGMTIGTALAALTMLSMVRPYESLLILAGVLPLSTVAYGLSGSGAGGFRLIEAMTLAYLTGWAVRRAVFSPPAVHVPSKLGWSAAALIVAALASGFVSAAVLMTEEAGQLRWSQVADWYRMYAIHLDAVTFAALFAEGVLLLLAVVHTCAGHPGRREGLVRMMVIGAAAAASLNVLRILVDGAMRREEPWREFLNLVVSLRVNVHHGDLNAAGSYFALMWFPALGLALRRSLAGAVCLVLITAGLWIAGSRVAFAATLIVAAIVMADRLARRRMKRGAVIAVILLAAAAVTAIWLPMRRHVANPSIALQIRLGLATGAIAMAADHPVFGVGLGRFYDLSAVYGGSKYVVRENAHNNYLQILAELGVPGLALFLMVVGAALAAARRAGSESESPPVWPLVAGLSAFLLTCIGGHPLLVPHAAFPFWMALGLAASVSSVRAPSRRVQIAGALVVALFVVTLPGRTLAGIRGAEVQHTSYGLSSLWQRGADGSRFRWAGGRATFFVPASARAIRVGLRHGSSRPDRLQVRIFLDGIEADRVLLNAGEDWTSVRLLLVRRVEKPSVRVDLETGLPGSLEPLEVAASNSGGLLMVGLPELER